MSNLPYNLNRKQFQAALVACRDTLSKVQALARHLLIDPSEMLILSRADNPNLRTIDDIVCAIPETVTLLGLDDAEYLLPETDRTVTKLKVVLEGAALRYAYRGLRILATTGIQCESCHSGRLQWL